VYSIEFWRSNSQEVTGEGDAQRIFATVLNAIQTFLTTKEQPRFISFTGEKGEETQDKDSRVNLYSRMVKRYAVSWGYRVKNVHDRGDAVTFDLTRIKQGVAEKMKMGATIEPMEDKEQSDPVVDATLKFYKPVMQKASEQEVDHYVEKAKHLLQKTDDPVVRKKLIYIFKEGQHNPYLQGGIITAIAALLGGGAINLANSIQLTPYQTNLMMQGILNTIVPTVGARMSGRNWVDTLKYTLASLGVGVGIATVMEKESDVIGHVAKDLIGKGAPIAKLRAIRDKEQMKKRERSDGLPVEPKFDYLDEK